MESIMKRYEKINEKARILSELFESTMELCKISTSFGLKKLAEDYFRIASMLHTEYGKCAIELNSLIKEISV